MSLVPFTPRFWLGAAAGAVVSLALAGGTVVLAGDVLAQTPPRDPGPGPAPIAAPAQAEPGVLIESVLPDSPAARAGLARGGIILSLGGQTVNTAEDLRRRIADRKAGDTVDVTFRHGDETRTRPVTLADRAGTPHLGVIPCGGDHERVFQIALPAAGAFVIEVVPDGPAAKAGVQKGDRITAIDGQAIEAGRSVTETLATRRPGQTVTLGLERVGEAARQARVELGRHPDRPDQAYLGVRLAPLPRFSPHADIRVKPFGDPGVLRNRPGWPGVESGAHVRRVIEGSPAAAAGIRPGDVITAVNGVSVTKPAAFEEAIGRHRPGDPVKLTLHRADSPAPVEVEARLGEAPDRPGRPYLGVEVDHLFAIRVLPGLGDGIKGDAPPNLELAPFPARPAKPIAAIDNRGIGPV